MSNILDIEVKVINGEILEFPKTISVATDRVIPLFKDFIREYDSNYCIVVTDIFLFQVGQDVFGTKDFTSYDEFLMFAQGSTGCYLTYGECILTFNGIPIAV